MIVHGMKGLGDNIYQRAFIRAIAEPVYLETPWPEIYRDLPHVHPMRPNTMLRTQAKNIRRQKGWATRVPPGHRSVTVRYGADGIFPGMARAFGITPATMDLPGFGPPPVDGPYVVVRPVTVRAEWRADSRNPLPEYVARAAAAARLAGYQIISVADLSPGQEWALSPLPEADIDYHEGELPVEQLLALVQGAAGVIGGIGWILPACIAAHVPALVICGGQGGYNAPSKITDPSMDLSPITFAVPDRLCPCTRKDHRCDKRIRNHDAIITRWVERLPAVEPGERHGVPHGPTDGLPARILD